MKPTKKCHIVLYKRRGETQWAIHYGWIPTDDAESLRQYFATWPDRDEFYVIQSEPQNNTLQLFSEVRSDFENHWSGDTGTPEQQKDRKAITKQLLRGNRARAREEEQAEAQLKEQFHQIATGIPAA